MSTTVTPEWVSAHKAVEHIRRKGIDAFTLESLRYYAYRTNLLPKPTVIGRHAYWRTADLDQLVAQL